MKISLLTEYLGMFDLLPAPGLFLKHPNSMSLSPQDLIISVLIKIEK